MHKTVALFFISLLIASGASTGFSPTYAKSSAREKNTAGAAQDNFDEGSKRFKRGDIDGAIDSFLQAVYFARNNYYPEAYFWLGESYRAKKEYAKAIDAFRKYLDQAVDSSPAAHVELGYVLMETNHDDEAGTEFYKAVGQTPRAQNALGKLAEKAGDFRIAAEHFREALGDPPWTYLDAWMNLAAAQLNAKDYGTAYREYERLLDSDSVKLSKEDRQKIYNGMGACLMAKGNHEGAMRHWRECLSINSANAQAHLNLGKMFDIEKHIGSAITEYKQYIGFADKDDDRVAAIKSRVLMLEQKIQADEPRAGIKPSPYMRKQAEEQDAAKRKAFEELNNTAPADNLF